MQNQPQQSTSKQQAPQPSERRPNERSGLDIAEFVRISDPQTKETHLETRG